MEQAIDIYTETNVLRVEDIENQVKLIHGLLNAVMDENVHYGVIPGTSGKPTLYKAGAEKINFMFRLSATYECEILDLPNSHREVVATCTLTHIPSSKVWGQGIGSCTTMEGKYRFRNDIEWTGNPVPKAYWSDRDVSLLGGRDFVAKKNDDGKWEIAKKSGKVEHDNPADYFNTVLKMAQKRAMVSCVIGSTAASDIFTVDIEDMPEVIPGAKGKAEPLNPVIQPDEISPAEVGDDPPDRTEKEWLEEEKRRDEANKGLADQDDIPFTERKFPGDQDKPKKVSKAKGGILYAKLKGIPGFGEDDREQFLRDIGVKSVYEVPEATFENVKNLLDSFYKKK